jgi:FdrA protein
LLDAAGVGVSHIVGVGGRDLSEDVGGIMFREGMRLLAEDDATETLLLVSKPPSPEAVRGLGEALPRDIRVVAAFVGWDRGDAPFDVHPTLEAGAAAAANTPPPDASALDRELDKRRTMSMGRTLLGLYTGGSLAHEAATIIEPQLGLLAGNVGHGEPKAAHGHRLFDLGEGEYTQGRPHPMVDLTVRVELLEHAAHDEDVGCVLIDVVLGHGAHPDPAAGLAAAVAMMSERGVVIAHVCGTDDDPQDASRQQRTLRDAGALLAPSNAAAARLALRAVRS